MALIDVFLGQIRPRRANEPPPFERYGGYPWRLPFGTGSLEDKALGLTAVYRSVTLIAGTAAGLPIHVYHKRDDGSRELVETDDVAYLYDSPNDEMTMQQYWETVIGHETMGDAFLWVQASRRGDPLNLWYIEPWRVRTGRASTGQKVYEVDGDPELTMTDFAQGGEIVHVPNWGRTSLRGINPIRIAAEAVALGLSAQEYATKFFDQDSVPRGLLTTDQTLNEKQADDLLKMWERHTAGRENYHRTAVLGNGAKFATFTINPSDAQLIEERRFQVQEIGRLFGVPPHMLGDVTGSTSWGTGIEAQTTGMLTFTLQAHINRFEQAINHALLRRRETGRYVKFTLGALTRARLLERYQAYAIGYGRFLTINDIRALEDLDPIEGGDDLLAMTNMVPLDQLGITTAPEQLPANEPGTALPSGG